ncbi:gliding motility lipoprotein GldH [Pedobacter sp. SYP-B3415]|uniref:gliding motility lipoprotein GldH n=1 Tax=Pedobacter sp. SYP-B3415 TaxID=2496641 RepID=UPI0013E9E4C5|nr:gliding motility lipoprotein GldH [Pedobacter sp. SYP-B3415]
MDKTESPIQETIRFRVPKLPLLAVLAGIVLLLAGCKPVVRTDTNDVLPGRKWSYTNKLKATFTISDPAVAYNLSFRFRHTASYAYSDLYILVHHYYPGQKKLTKRYHIPVAGADGIWLGSGSGNLYTCVFPIIRNGRFPRAGNYTIEIEQNMKDNPLREITDGGISLEPAER